MNQRVLEKSDFEYVAWHRVLRCYIDHFGRRLTKEEAERYNARVHIYAYEQRKKNATKMQDL